MSVRVLTGLVILAYCEICNGQQDCRIVSVWATGDRSGVSAFEQAEQAVREMFAPAGIKVDWRRQALQLSTKDCGPRLVIRMITGVNLTHNPRALAYAEPFSDRATCITVFWDQVRKASYNDSQIRQSLLAHVLTHEITHVLQGVAVHSETGIMQASWMPSDYRRMRYQRFSFTQSDLRLIELGLARWNRRQTDRTLAEGTGER